MRERLLVGVLSLVATYIFFFEYLPPFKRVHLWSDLGGYHYPLHRFAFQALKEGRVPLWDSSIYCGISLVGNVQAALLYPGTWLMYAGSWRMQRFPYKGLEDFTLAHVWLGFLLSYLWFRSKTGKLVSSLSASVFAFSGYMLWQTLHPGVLVAMAWMPLGFWGIDEAVERRSWTPLWKVALASAFSFLAGYPAAWIVNCVVFVAYGLVSRSVVAAIGTCAAIAASLLLSMAQLAPTLEARSMMVLEDKYGPGAYRLTQLLRSFFVPNWFDFNPGHTANYDPGCMYLYLGLPAIFGLLWAVRRCVIRPYFQAAVVIALALLLANPPALLLHVVGWAPALMSTMQPYNFYAAIAPMAALITAVSVDAFLKRRTERRIAGWKAVVIALILALWFLRQLQVWVDGGQFATGRHIAQRTLIAFVLFSMAMWGVRQSTSWRRTLLASVVLFAVGTDYMVFGSGRWFNAENGDLDTVDPPYGIGGIDNAAYGAMRANPHFREVTDHSSGPHPLQYRLFGLTTPEGFDPFLTTQYKKRIEQWVSFRTNRMFDTDVLNEDMLQTLGVRYVFVRRGTEHDPLLAESPSFRLVGRKDIFGHVYEYVHAKPVHRWENGAGRATVLSWTAERRRVLVDSAQGGRFVLVEQYFPGWRASVDGRRVEIERWSGAFQAIQLPGGQHTVAFEYRPMSLFVGAQISLLSFGALVLVIRADRRSRRSALQTARIEKRSGEV